MSTSMVAAIPAGASQSVGGPVGSNVGVAAASATANPAGDFKAALHNAHAVDNGDSDSDPGAAVDTPNTPDGKNDSRRHKHKSSANAGASVVAAAVSGTVSTSNTGHRTHSADGSVRPASADVGAPRQGAGSASPGTDSTVSGGVAAGKQGESMAPSSNVPSPVVDGGARALAGDEHGQGNGGTPSSRESAGGAAQSSGQAQKTVSGATKDAGQAQTAGQLAQVAAQAPGGQPGSQDSSKVAVAAGASRAANAKGHHGGGGATEGADAEAGSVQDLGQRGSGDPVLNRVGTRAQPNAMAAWRAASDDHRGEGGQGQTLLTQAQPSAPGVSTLQVGGAPAPAPSSPPIVLVAQSTPGQPQFGYEMAQHVTWLASQGVTQATVQVNPPQLGPVHIQVLSHHQTINVAFAVQNPQTAQALQNSLPQLNQMLSQQGLNLGQATVGQQGHGGQASQGGGPWHGGAGPGAGSTRRVNQGPTVLRTTRQGGVDAFA